MSTRSASRPRPRRTPRKRNRRRTPIRDVARKTLALGLALTALLLLFSPDDRPAAAAVTVVVAARDIPAGTAISEADVDVVERPPDVVPATALTSMADVAARATVSAVREGEVLTDARLAGAPAYDVPDGFVPLVIAITDEQTLATIERGACIDVYAGFAGTPIEPVATQAILLDIRTAEAGGTDPGPAQYSAASAHIVAAVADTQVTTVVSSLGADFILATLCLAWPSTVDQEPS
ncbi:hypothetical protein EK0264_13340 [Epidermidibacterium keratini]|uniref:SAF domain-containing protein n=1 Tax=Epidermidibacterium keratini TaxID=1891644 RepID=A0A7L4YQW2_9ACTN|nr:SAF domain-containing protein [Epidermidibacterium keratini]QHC01179.1 hypothetical protein EK0264_13340 [Epidermidibacterium keratini]